MYGIERSEELWQYHPRAPMTLMLEDRIRELCSQAVVADDAQELNCILGELKLALHERTPSGSEPCCLSILILPPDLVKPDL